MRNKEAAEADANIAERIVQIEQMTLQEIAALTSRMATEIVTGKVTGREARQIDRAVGKRLMAIERGSALTRQRAQ